MTARASLVLLAGAILGCGYELLSYPTDRDFSLGVAVETLRNDSFDPGYEFVLGDALRREFARRGALRLVSGPEAADVVLRGRIPAIETRRRSFSSVVLTLEYQVDVSLELVVLRAGAPLGIDRRLLNERDLYLASADVEATRKNRDEALRRIAGVLAARVHDVVYELAPPP